MKNAPPAKVKVRVTTGAVKIHGPNSVLAPEGTRETLPTEGPRLIEVTKDVAVSMFGQETADKLFKGVEDA
jgi:hypothetical protein